MEDGAGPVAGQQQIAPSADVQPGRGQGTLPQHTGGLQQFRLRGVFYEGSGAGVYSEGIVSQQGIIFMNVQHNGISSQWHISVNTGNPGS